MRKRFTSRYGCVSTEERLSKGPGDLFKIDLVDLGNISSHNDGYRYLLTCLDVFSKRAWAVATKTKTGREVSQAFEKILADGYKFNMVQSDKGTHGIFKFHVPVDVKTT